jgi:Fe-S oxidoreductase
VVETVKQRIEGRKNFPTHEVDPKNFLSDEEVRKLIDDKDNFRFNEDDYSKIFNCVHCGECDTEDYRIKLKEKYLEDGNSFEGLEEMKEFFEKYRSPYPSNTMRIKKPKDIPKESETLFFMGCLSTIRIPRYTEHALKFLLKQNINFTILETEICCGWHLLVSGLREEYETCKRDNIEIFKKFKKIICLCPACYDLFRKDYINDMQNKVKVEYIADYLQPSENEKDGKVAVQHLCQLRNRGREGIDKLVNNVLIKSGYNIIDVPHWCCGGGSGYMGRTDIIDEIAKKRMMDFNKDEIDFITTYCPSCWWILARFSKIHKIKPRAKDIFELLL